MPRDRRFSPHHSLGGVSISDRGEELPQNDFTPIYCEEISAHNGGELVGVSFV